MGERSGREVLRESPDRVGEQRDECDDVRDDPREKGAFQREVEVEEDEHEDDERGRLDRLVEPCVREGVLEPLEDGGEEGAEQGQTHRDRKEAEHESERATLCRVKHGGDRPREEVDESRGGERRDTGDHRRPPDHPAPKCRVRVLRNRPGHRLMETDQRNQGEESREGQPEIEVPELGDRHMPGDVDPPDEVQKEQGERPEDHDDGSPSQGVDRRGLVLGRWVHSRSLLGIKGQVEV